MIIRLIIRLIAVLFLLLGSNSNMMGQHAKSVVKAVEVSIPKGPNIKIGVLGSRPVVDVPINHGKVDIRRFLNALTITPYKEALTPATIIQTKPNYTQPSVETQNQPNIGFLDVYSDTPFQIKGEVNFNVEESLSIDNNEWWIDYIGNIIDEQIIRLRLDQREKQLFKKGMKFEFKRKPDKVGYFIYNYENEYKLDAA